MRIIAVVICFHPNKKGLYNNIKAFADYVEEIIVWKNSVEDFSFLAEWNEKIVYMGNETNLYMGKPLNEALRYATLNNFDYLLTMDQDSLWENFNDFRTYVNESSDAYVAIYSPNVNNQFEDKNKTFEDTNWVIQSGMLVNVRIANYLNGFREDYKIYGVDEEFCNWVRINGYKTRVFINCHLKQCFGKITKTIFGFETLNYSPIVRFFLMRNIIWMKREFHDSVSIKRIVYIFLLHLRGILLGEDNKLHKLYKLILGVFDGIFAKIEKRK